jgi:hypothetical protein
MTKPSPSRPLDTFEQRLLAELTTVVVQRAQDLGTDPAPGDASPVPARRPARRRLLPVTAAATIVGTATAIGLLHLGSAEPAYAVEKRPDGTVMISMSDLNRLDGLPDRLKDVGIAARIVPMTASCREPRPTKVFNETPTIYVLGSYPVQPGSRITVWVAPGAVPPGHYFVIGKATNAGPDGNMTVLDEGITSGPQTCIPMPPPAEPGPGQSSPPGAYLPDPANPSTPSR